MVMSSEDKPESVAICFAQGHGEKLVIEQVQHEGLVDMLFRSGYRLGKIETWISWQKLCDYQVLVIGSPQGGLLEDTEIKAIVEFVNSGGSLFLISDEGGDAKAKSNLNDVAKAFGFSFTPGIIVDTVEFSERQEYIRPRITARHFITREVAQIVFASGCDIELQDEGITILAKSGPSAMRNPWKDGEWGEAVPAPDRPVLIVKRHGQGKVVACGNFSIITSISKTYGLFAANNFTLIGNIFAWLANKKAEDVSSKSDVVHLNIAVEEDLFYWMEGEVKDKQRFDNVNALINFALNAVKQSFDNLETGEGEAGEESSEPAVEEEAVKPAASEAAAKPAASEAAAPQAGASTEKPAAVTPEAKPAPAKEPPAKKQQESQKPSGQKPDPQKSQGKGYPSQGKRPGSKGYRPPERNLVFKAKPGAIEAIKKQKPGEQKPAKLAEKQKAEEQKPAKPAEKQN
jgi:hypothetical protein